MASCKHGAVTLKFTTRNLQQWALVAASRFSDLEFKVSATWVKSLSKGIKSDREMLHKRDNYN